MSASSCSSNGSDHSSIIANQLATLSLAEPQQQVNFSVIHTLISHHLQTNQQPEAKAQASLFQDQKKILQYHYFNFTLEQLTFSLCLYHAMANDDPDRELIDMLCDISTTFLTDYGFTLKFKPNHLPASWCQELQSQHLEGRSFTQKLQFFSHILPEVSSDHSTENICPLQDWHELCLSLRTLIPSLSANKAKAQMAFNAWANMPSRSVQEICLVSTALGYLFALPSNETFSLESWALDPRAQDFAISYCYDLLGPDRRKIQVKDAAKAVDILCMFAGNDLSSFNWVSLLSTAQLSLLIACAEGPCIPKGIVLPLLLRLFEERTLQPDKVFDALDQVAEFPEFKMLKIHEALVVLRKSASYIAYLRQNDLLEDNLSRIDCFYEKFSNVEWDLNHLFPSRIDRLAIFDIQQRHPNSPFSLAGLILQELTALNNELILSNLAIALSKMKLQHIRLLVKATQKLIKMKRSEHDLTLLQLQILKKNELITALIDTLSSIQFESHQTESLPYIKPLLTAHLSRHPRELMLELQGDVLKVCRLRDAQMFKPTPKPPAVIGRQALMPVAQNGSFPVLKKSKKLPPSRLANPPQL